ncbi:MAG: hypothetical protein ACTHMC_10220 [Pseudobacter sp.]|uniref:hypothetical protein n=1 Tax=Pseudobacter sp. TaxID=2045420 RepID=UPI003F81994C
MKKLILLLAATMFVTVSLQAQLLKKMADKVNSAVQRSVDKAIDKSVDKTVDKTVGKPTGKAAEKTKEGSAGSPAFPPEADVVNRPSYLAIDSKDNMYVIDRDGIVMITPDGTVKRIHSSGGHHIIIDEKDNMFIMFGSTINKMKVVNGKCETEYYAGDKNYSGFEDGDLKSAKFNSFRSVAFGSNGDIYIADVASSCLKSIGGVKTGRVAYEPGIPEKLRTDGSWDYWCIIRKVSNGKVTTLKNSEGQYLLLCLADMAVDKDDNIIFSGGGISRSVRKLNTKTLQVNTMAGKPYKRQWCPVYTTGDTSKAELFDPGYVVLDKKGDIVYADNRSHRITKIANGKVITLAGNGAIADCGKNIGGFAEEGHKDGKALAALFNFPDCMAYDSKGNLFIVDTKNLVIRKLTPDGIVSSFTPFDRSKADISN